MKSILRFVGVILLIGVLFHLSCKKEHSCESCKSNKPPLANAGPDQVITLPTDSVSLDGNVSSDPDGKISKWLWTKISGPASFNIIKSTDSTTKIKALVTGTYQFELKVSDNGGLFAKDTVRIVVNNPAQPNRPPVANAGSDQIITLPANTINLDGSGSTDPDNNITSYAWAKISGPSSFNIINVNNAQTQVTNLAEGVYLFELKVTDAGNLFSKDTVQVSVNPSTVTVPCDNSTRSLVNAQLIPFTTIPNVTHTRDFQYRSIATGNKLVFLPDYFYWAGLGHNPIYIFDMVSNSWSTAELSVPRFPVGVAVHGNKIYFAGGGYNDGNSIDTTYNTIDIYDASSNTWSVSSLIVPRYCGDGAVLDNKIFFPCGDIVQIFNTTTGNCTTANLSVPRNSLSAIAADNKVYFAGGTDWSGIFNRVDVYDNTTNAWSQFSLIEPKAGMASIAVGNKIYWAGGYNSYSPAVFSSLVEAYDINTQSSTTACLFKPKKGFKAVLKENKIIFFTETWNNPENKFDIYDISTNTWSIGVLPVNIEYETIVSHNNTIYVAGGVINGSITQQVWKLVF